MPAALRFVRVPAVVVALSGLLSACAGPLTTVAPVLPASYERLGRAEGSACGSLLFHVIPIALNGRIGRAYQRALQGVSGAQGLADVTLTERWYWWWIGTTRCTTLSGVGAR